MTKPVAAPGEISLDELLTQIQERHIILQQFGGRVCLWSPNVRVSRKIRRALKRYQSELLALLEVSDVRVCPSPALHRKYHRRGTCMACRRLLPEVEMVRDAGKQSCSKDVAA